MPKNRKPARKQAATLRVSAVLGDIDREMLSRVGSLEVVQGAEVDLGRHVLCDHPIVIGRDERVDLSLNDGSISRAHCTVERDSKNGAYVLIDLGSTNGTSVNGKPVDEKVELNPSDKIFLGSSVIRFTLSDQMDLAYHSRLEELVSTDPLTGLGSRRQYDALFESLSSQALAEESPLTVLVMDMDGLKGINDTHGHEMGSFSITEVANLISEVLGEYGHLARFGGDEFVGCFPAVSCNEALELSEDLLEKINAHRFESEGTVVHPTLSIGVATFPVHTRKPEELFRIADQALYEAKRAGKNRVQQAASSG